MQRKIVGIFVMMLLITITFSSAADVSMIPVKEKQMDSASLSTNEEELTSGLQDFLYEQETKIERVKLKFFNYSGFKKNLTKIVKKVNEIFEIVEGENNVQFDWNKTYVTLPDSNFTDNTSSGRSKLLKDLKKRKNCSKGINVVFAPNDYLPRRTNGETTHIVCHGVRNPSKGGIIINNTCNEAQMIKTLAHELMHALGVSHDQVKIYNASSGKNESKKIETKVVPYGGDPSNPEILKKYWLGFPCPPDGPHAYGYWDRDGDCWCNYSSDPAKNEVRPSGGFDINGNCTFGDAEDREHLLWGYADTRTDEEISDAQRDYMYENAEKTPDPDKETVGKKSKEQAVTPSYASPDDEIDLPAEFGYVNLVGSTGILFWEDYYISLSLGVINEMPDDLVLYYDFYIDKDNDPDTGSPCGSEYIVAFTKSPEYTGAELYEYVDGERGWQYLEDLNWSISSAVTVWHSDDDCGIIDANDYRVTVVVPIGSLTLRFKDYMKITAKTTDYINDATDECPPMFLSKEIEFLPMLDLNTYTESPGETVILTGYLFTPNTDVTIDFDWEAVATSTTDNQGGFTGYFIVPSLPGGYYHVKATDENGKSRTRLFYVDAPENQPPTAPTIVGKLKGNAGKEYEYTFNAVDPDGHDVKYHIDWDDGDSDETGLYPSGEDVKVKHTWDSDGTYTIRAYAEDEFGLVGPQGSLTVQMPRNRPYINTPFLNWLQNYLNMFPILRQILLRLGLQN